jgi:8-oxo-dGTP diphosphatase
MTIHAAEPYPPIWVTVDLVIFTVRRGKLQVLLIRRATEPFGGMIALPGGYVQEGETLDQAALRKLSHETGVDGRQLHLEQLRTYGDPGRDPRGRIVTVAYLALSPDIPEPQGATEDAHWAPVETVLDDTKLAFDHFEILREAVDRAQSKLEYTTVAAAFCPAPFTVADLRHIYEVVWGISIDPSNFRRKVTRAENFLVPIGERRNSEPGRPAALYRRGPAHLLYPPLLRSPDAAREQFPSSSLT